MASMYVPLELLPGLYGVSASTIRRWMERDGVEAVWMPNAVTNGRKGVRRSDIPQSWGAMNVTPDGTGRAMGKPLSLAELFGLSDRMVAVDQLPRLCRVGPRTIRRWMERDEVEAVWIDRKKYVRFADIDGWPIRFDIGHGGE